jgi:hypothetical protein
VRQLLFLSHLMLATLVVGCSGARPAPAKPPAVDPETRLEPGRRPAREEPLKILAPPPAYGNKIVMARGAAREKL